MGTPSVLIRLGLLGILTRWRPRSTKTLLLPFLLTRCHGILGGWNPPSKTIRITGVHRSTYQRSASNLVLF
uniref:Putative secreted protein n=1 Tax=Anopheles triannulatus TaxID=58253 RepID=A0A2M4B814_9DIPT